MKKVDDTGAPICDRLLSDPGEDRSDLWVRNPDVRPSLTPTPCVDLTDVTPADEDTKSIPIDGAIKGNMAMHVRQPGGQLWNQCKQMAPSGGQIWK